MFQQLIKLGFQTIELSTFGKVFSVNFQSWWTKLWHRTEVVISAYIEPKVYYRTLWAELQAKFNKLAAFWP